MRFLPLVLLLVCCSSQPAPTCPDSLVITELGIRGDSYIELYNPTTTSLTLDPLTLSITGSGAPRTESISGTLDPKDYISIPVRALADDGGTVRLSCNDVLIDAVQYGRGTAEVLAFGDPPDAFANDDVDRWCSQPASPGAANASCTTADCNDPDAITPSNGDVTITDACGNPEGPDAGNEWVDLTVVSTDPVQLGGLTLTHTRSDGTSRTWTLDCQVAAPDELVRIAYDDLALYNASDTTLALMLGDEEIASLALPSLTEEGCSAGCDATVAEEGDLVISEVLRDPEGADADGEWIELYVAASHSVLLDGLSIRESASTTRTWVVAPGTCATAEANDFVVLGAGGVPLDGTASFFNTAATLELWRDDVMINTAIIDCGVDGKSCANDNDGDWCETTPTPGAENDCDA